MENNLENKAKFFALYWGQQVCVYPTNSLAGKSGGMDIVGWMISSADLTNYYLELKPLSSISDKDAMKVAGLAFGYSKFNRNIKVTKTSPKNFGFSFYHNSINNDHLEYLIDFGGFYNPTIIYLSRKTLPQEYIHNVQGIVDYLRSRGYALPWMGLSVEELVNRGWIKLKGETK